jgi:hypothetical protein
MATYLVETPHPVEHAVEVLAGEQSSGTTVDTPRAPAFEEAWVSCDPDAVLGFFAVDAEVRLGAPLFRDRASYKAERQARDLVRERLLVNDDVRVGPTNKQAVADALETEKP